MVLRHCVIGLHNYDLFYQKILRKLNHSKYLRGKYKAGSVTIVDADYVNIVGRIFDFFNYF